MKMHYLAVVGATMAIGSVAHAATFTLNFTNVYTGDTPGGTGPFATAVFTDVAANTVNLVLTHNSTSASPQFLTLLRLNVEPTVGSIATTAIGGKTTAFQGASVGSATDAGTNFDFSIDFGTSNAGGGIQRLNSGDSITLQMVGTGLTALSFDSYSTGGTPVQGLLHLQGIAPNGSAKLAGEAVPEPATFAVLAGLGLAAARKRRK
ncbi:MAG: PEP-CTERM sorting domain-containing protein [Fimbriimonadaceae bacterium]|nr:MAG: PEP-CTERM sorting domain-containing protein [Fimbriimonadaceae bacterium]